MGRYDASCMPAHGDLATASDGTRTSEKKHISFAVRVVRIAVLLVGALAISAFAGWIYSVRMPGDSFAGAAPMPTTVERDLTTRLEADVRHLCEVTPERNWTDPGDYEAAAAWLEQRFREAGYPQVARHSYPALAEEFHNAEFHNIEATLVGSDRAAEIVVIGAHYDAVAGTVGANDNASGVAALLALAERLRTSTPRRTVRFLAFANEEPPHFQTDEMGSLVYARVCRARGDEIVAMMSFDGIGYYTDADETQHYPSVLGLAYPSRGDFVAFVGNPASRSLVHRVIETFRKHAQMPSEGAVLPSDLTGVGWSDHWSFWQCGYPALEITDTLPFRYAHYHKATDTPDRLDYVRMARVALGIEAVLRELADA